MLTVIVNIERLVLLTPRFPQ